jgi:hypothetical protein
MEKPEHQPDNYFANVRIALIVIAVVSFPFNLVGSLTYNAETGSINQIVAVSKPLYTFSPDMVVTRIFYHLAQLLWPVIHYMPLSVPASSP